MKQKDMYIPQWVRNVGIGFLVMMVVTIILTIVNSEYRLVWAILDFCLLASGVAVIMLWKNEWIEILNDEEFVHSTFFGKKTRYHFSDVREIKRNSDSITVIMSNGKIHIENVAVTSEKLRNALYAAEKG